jgi:hypothetical protein
MRSINEAAVPQPRRLPRLVAALWASREVSFRVRPGYALLAALAVTAAVWQFSPAPSPAAVDAVDTTQLFVQFRLQAPGVSSVRLAGSFTDWEPRHELHETVPGMWTVTLPLPLGVHDYSFVVDGVRWVPDPYAPGVDDGFGGRNSRIALLPPDSPRS